MKTAADSFPGRAKSWLRTHADALVIFLAAFLATLPLLLRGTSCGHDLSFHLLNWQEVATQWTHGTLRPFWAFHAAWNAGEPRFVFYPPLSWTLGALLGLALPWTATPIAYTFVTLALCGLTMRVLLRRFVPPTLAIAGACIYLANPYMLFVAYERTAYAELLAAAWMPLLLLAVLQKKVHPNHLALVVALLWLTNAPAAIIGSYTLLLLAVVRLTQTALQDTPDRIANLRTDASRLTAGYLLGLALASFFLVPAIAQRSLVQLAMANAPGMRPRDSFLFGHTGQPFHDAVLRSASWAAVAILTVAILCAAVLLSRRKKRQSYHSMQARDTVRHRTQPANIFALALLSIVLLLLLTHFSAPIWTHAPQLAILQFPWRFLSIEAAVATLLLTLVAASWRTSQRFALAAALLFAAAMPWAGHKLYAQPCDEEDNPAAQRERYVTDRGSEPTDEYTPVDADNDALHPDLPAAWLTTQENAPPDPATLPDVVATSDGNPEHLHFDIRSATQPRSLVVRLRAYAGWSLQIDGRDQSITPTRDDDLLTVDLPPGPAYTVDLRLQWTSSAYAGLALSLAALLLLLFRRSNAQRHA